MGSLFHADRGVPIACRLTLRDRKFADSSLEGAVSSEPVSESPKFPASRQNTGNFIESRPRCASISAKMISRSVPYDPNSLRIRTGNFLLPNRELYPAIREISVLIREFCSRPLFCDCLCPTIPSSPRDLWPRQEPRRTRKGARSWFCRLGRRLAKRLQIGPCHRAVFDAARRLPPSLL